MARHENATTYENWATKSQSKTGRTEDEERRFTSTQGEERKRRKEAIEGMSACCFLTIEDKPLCSKPPKNQRQFASGLVLGIVALFFVQTSPEHMMMHKNNRFMIVTEILNYEKWTWRLSHQACITHGRRAACGPRNLFLWPARAFSIVENAAKARPQISNCRSTISSILQQNLYIEMKDFCDPV